MRRTVPPGVDQLQADPVLVWDAPRAPPAFHVAVYRSELRPVACVRSGVAPVGQSLYSRRGGGAMVSEAIRRAVGTAIVEAENASISGTTYGAVAAKLKLDVHEVREAVGALGDGFQDVDGTDEIVWKDESTMHRLGKLVGVPYAKPKA